MSDNNNTVILARICKEIVARQIVLERRIGATHSDLHEARQLEARLDIMLDDLDPDDKDHLDKPNIGRPIDKPNMPYPKVALGTGLRPGEPRAAGVAMPPDTTEPTPI